MPKNAGVIDWKPRSEAVIDWKPRNEAILEYKPKMVEVGAEISAFTERVLGAGQSIGPGFFMFLTYPAEITVTS